MLRPHATHSEVNLPVLDHKLILQKMNLKEEGLSKMGVLFDESTRK